MEQIDAMKKYQKQKPMPMTESEITGYGKRIGIKRDRIQVNEAGLDELIWANLTHIPFENLTVTQEGKVPSLEDEDLYRKIVEKRRGGYCFEQNRIFYRFLHSVGFCVWPIAVRILLNKQAMPAPTHRASVVEINGEKYLADVGFGGPGPKGALKLAEGTVCIRGSEFLIQKQGEEIWVIHALLHGEYVPLFYVEEKEAFEIDFDLMNFFCAKCDRVIFSHTTVMNLCTEDGSVALTGQKLSLRKNGVLTEKEIVTKEDLKRCCEEYFGIGLS